MIAITVIAAFIAGLNAAMAIGHAYLREPWRSAALRTLVLLGIAIYAGCR